VINWFCLNFFIQGIVLQYFRRLMWLNGIWAGSNQNSAGQHSPLTPQTGLGVTVSLAGGFLWFLCVFHLAGQKQSHCAQCVKGFSLPHLPILVSIPLYFSLCLWWWLLAELPRIYPPCTPFPVITSQLQLPELIFYSNLQCENKLLSKCKNAFIYSYALFLIWYADYRQHKMRF